MDGEGPINPVGGVRHRAKRKSYKFEIDQALGATLRRLRLSRGLNQTELGRRLGVSLQQVQKYESGSNRLAASTVFRAAEVLGVEVGAFYAGLRGGSARARGSPRKQSSSVLIVPLCVGPGAAPAREAELIDVCRSYQAIATAGDRALVRKLVKRLSAASARTGTASR